MQNKKTLLFSGKVLKARLESRVPNWGLVDL